jgi:hypothetical protein
MENMDIERELVRMYREEKRLREEAVERLEEAEERLEEVEAQLEEAEEQRDAAQGRARMLQNMISGHTVSKQSLLLLDAFIHRLIGSTCSRHFLNDGRATVPVSGSSTNSWHFLENFLRAVWRSWQA